MGLCIGASLMSFIELLDLILSYLLLFSGCKQKNQVEDEEQAET